MDRTLLLPHQHAAVALLQDGHLPVRRGHSPRGWPLPGGFVDTRASPGDRELREEMATFHSRFGFVMRRTRQEERLVLVVRAIASRHPHAEVRVVEQHDAVGEPHLAIMTGKGTDDDVFAVRPLDDADDLIVTALSHLEAWMLSRRLVLAVAPRYLRHAPVRPQRGDDRIMIVDESHSLRDGRSSARSQTLEGLASRFRPS